MLADILDWSWIPGLLYAVFVIALCIRVLMETRTSSKAVAYILLIILLPALGIIIYLFVGRNVKKKHLYSKKLSIDFRQTSNLKQLFEDYRTEKAAEFKAEYEQFAGNAQMLFSDNKSILTHHNAVTIHINGEEKFPQLLQDIRQAKEHIHLEYYIYENDGIGNELAELLIQKAKEGVKVRFIYDDFGSRKIAGNIAKRLKENGVETYPFYEVIFSALADRLNYRNHRKLVIIDGHTAYLGGINVSDRYINSEGENKMFWRDTHLRICGTAVWNIQHLFLCDWNFASGQNLSYSRTFFKDTAFLKPMHQEKTWVQIASGGPDSEIPSILFAYLEAIESAQSHIDITTPYFIPSISLLHALHMAILRGVRVRLLVPGISDSYIANLASFSYYDEIIKMGVELYFYQKGFIHAKSICIDDMFSMVGSANLDIRSFEFNFEVNALIYDKKIALRLREIFEEDLKEARLIRHAEWEKRSFVRRLMERTVRIISPLL